MGLTYYRIYNRYFEQTETDLQRREHKRGADRILESPLAFDTVMVRRVYRRRLPPARPDINLKCYLIAALGGLPVLSGLP